ncbi:RDD family protein [Crassaminicella indica]|uniref:RDD family protein n=1 Tax=Crassaminicella indica TaxID=2855394 RepID=A0ABX8RCU3_9CLOT|nr:RDD family protein [Crassaminicella indica]QXM06272.1 RDD family protein [Crassaminicella indica]
MQFVSITTPENIEVKFRLAGVGSRVVAAFIDYLIQGVVYLIFILALAGMNDPIEYFEGKNSYFLAIVLLIIVCVNYGYFIISEMVMNGRTLGKKALGLRTIRKNGQPMDIKHSLIRNLFRIFVDNYLVGILMIFFRGDDARLGDILASTMVIEEEKKELYDYFDDLSEDIKNKLTEDEKQLLITYINEKDEVSIDKEVLQQKIVDYFTSKYNDVDEEILSIVKK